MNDPQPAPAPSPEPTPAPPGATVSVPRPPATPPAPPSSPLVRIAGTFYAVVALFAFGYALFSGGIGSLFGTAAPNIGGLLGGIGIGVVIVAVTRVGVKMWPAVDDAARTLSLAIGPLSRKDAILLAIFSGVAEELLFRGALWEHLDGIVGTSLLFALVHVVPRRKLWGYPVFALGAGLLFGLLRGGTDSVLPCMLAHVTVNALNLVYLADRHEAFAAEAQAAPTSGAPA